MPTLRLVHALPRSRPRGGASAGRRRRADPIVQALLEQARVITPLPRAVRARVLARARAAMVAWPLSRSPR